MLFGEGASADADVPMANEFVNRMESHLSTLRRPGERSGTKRVRRDPHLPKVRIGAEPGLESIFECVDDALEGRFAPSSVSYPASRAVERIH